MVPISETTVQLEYDIPSSNPITLLLEYDPLSRRLVDASVSNVLTFVYLLSYEKSEGNGLLLFFMSRSKERGIGKRDKLTISYSGLISISRKLSTGLLCRTMFQD